MKAHSYRISSADLTYSSDLMGDVLKIASVSDMIMWSHVTPEQLVAIHRYSGFGWLHTMGEANPISYRLTAMSDVLYSSNVWGNYLVNRMVCSPVRAVDLPEFEFHNIDFSGSFDPRYEDAHERVTLTALAMGRIVLFSADCRVPIPEQKVYHSEQHWILDGHGDVNHLGMIPPSGIRLVTALKFAQRLSHPAVNRVAMVNVINVAGHAA